MTTGLLELTVAEALGGSALPNGLDNLAVVIGCSSAGSGFQGYFLSGQAAQTAVGYGDGPDTLCQMIEQVQDGAQQSPKVPVAFYTVPATVPGEYGAITFTGTGTAVPTAGSSLPRGTDTQTVVIVNGGTVGTAGITYKTARDYANPDPSFSKVTALGTGTSITVGNSGASYVLEPPSATLTALYTKLNTFKGVLTGSGHFVDVSGGTPIHAAADTTDDTALAAVANATTPATAVTLFNAIKQYLGVHGASAVYHAGADAPLAAALLLISNASNVADVDLRLPALITAYEAHRVNVTGVHGSADATNTISAYTAGPGTLVAGDQWTCRTLAPAPDATDVDNAFIALAAQGKSFGAVVCEFPVNAALAAHVTTGANLLRTAKGRRVSVLMRTRLPDWETSETEQAWADDIAADFFSFDDSRDHLRATYGLIRDAMTGNTYLRSDLAQNAADFVRVGISTYYGSPNDAPNGISNFSLTDYAGTLVGHDEGPGGAVTGLSNTDLGNRFGCNQRLGAVDGALANAVFNTVPWILFSASENLRTIMDRRVANAMERDAVILGVPALGQRIFTIDPDPNVPGSLPTLADESRNAIQGSIYNGLSVRYAGDIANADDADPDTGLVQVASNVVRLPGGLVQVEVTLAVKRVNYLIKLSFTYAVTG